MAVRNDVTSCYRSKKEIKKIRESPDEISTVPHRWDSSARR